MMFEYPVNEMVCMVQVCNVIGGAAGSLNK